MATKYQIHERFKKSPLLITRIKGELVNLKGEKATQKIPGRKGGPPVTVTARAATQADLRYLVEDDSGDWSNIIVPLAEEPAEAED